MDNKDESTLASQSQAAQPSDELLIRLQWAVQFIDTYAREAAMPATPELNKCRAAITAHLAGQSQATRAVPDLHNAIMNLPCERTMSHFATTDTMRAYKEGHRDARHAAAELVNEFEAAQEVTQQAAKAETAEQAEGDRANVLPPTRGTGGQRDAVIAQLASALRSANLLLAETFISTGKVMSERASKVSYQIEMALVAASDDELASGFREGHK